MKIKCYKIECEICKVVGSCQVFYNAQGIAKYSRVRHYDKRLNGKPQFTYHPQDLSYVSGKLGEGFLLSGQIEGQNINSNGDQQNPELSPKSENKARDVGFEPTRPFDHRLSRPAPYQAWAIPHRLSNCAN